MKCTHFKLQKTKHKGIFSQISVKVLQGDSECCYNESNDTQHQRDNNKRINHDNKSFISIALCM